MSSLRADVAERILELDRCDELGAISALPGRIDRFHLTPEHARANGWWRGWMAEAGMVTRVDAAGNVCGRIEGREPGLPALLLGSHLDTVPDAGRYDGPARRRARDRGRLAAAAGRRPPVRGRGDRLQRRGRCPVRGDPAGQPRRRRHLGARTGSRWPTTTGCRWPRPSRTSGSTRAGRRRGPRSESVVGYLEAHIEQGPELEDADRRARRRPVDRRRPPVRAHGAGRGPARRRHAVSVAVGTR